MLTSFICPLVVLEVRQLLDLIQGLDTRMSSYVKIAIHVYSISLTFQLPFTLGMHGRDDIPYIVTEISGNKN